MVLFIMGCVFFKKKYLLIQYTSSLIGANINGPANRNNVTLTNAISGFALFLEIFGNESMRLAQVEERATHRLGRRR